MRLSTSFVIALMAAACSDYEIQGNNSKVNDDVEEGDPDIEVDPVKINFGELAVGEGVSVSEVVTVKNVGTGNLNIDDLSLQDDSMPYEISAIGSIVVPPEGSTTFTVTYTPITAVESNTSVLIESDDPDESTAEVKLLAQGIAPVIVLDPVSYDFGTIYIGCESPQPVTISNAGNADLIVSDFDYITASNDLSVDQNEGVNGELPWTIAPGDSRQVFVDYAPLDDYPDEGFLVVSSNDPIQGEAQAQQTAAGELYGEQLDIFEQALRSSTDLLFIIDNSCSMAEEQTNLANNFEYFAEELALVDLDYQLAVITTDNPEFRGDIITPTTPDLVDELTTQTSAGIGGSGNEMPSEMAYQATQVGGDAGPGSDFLRDDSMLSMIFVSDEPDSSPSSWSTYFTYFASLKSDPDNLVVHAISGDWPTGCSSASATNNVYELTVATDGLYLSVCSTDWASHLEALADASAQDLSSFELTDEPVPSTIVVTIDGVIQTSGWTYNAVDRSVDFDDDHIPAGGSTIEVEYALYGNCSE